MGISEITTKQTHSTLLKLPYEIRLLIYQHIFIHARVEIGVRSKDEYLTGHGNLWKLAIGDEYNIVLTCKQCRTEARPIFTGLADFYYDGRYSTREITTLCSGSMAAHVRRLSGIEGLYFEDFEAMPSVYPRLKELHVKVYGVQGVGRPMLEHEYRLLTFTSFINRYLVLSKMQSDLLRFLKHDASFQTFITAWAVVDYFGDNSREFRRIMKVTLDIKNGLLTAEEA